MLPNARQYSSRIEDHQQEHPRRDDSRNRHRSRSPKDGFHSEHVRGEAKLRRIEERRKEDQEIAEAEIEWGKRQDLSSKAQPPSQASMNNISNPSTTTSRRSEIKWDDPARHFLESLKTGRQKFRVPPNRFNIPPGPYWDGIDRSNGFERKHFQKMAGREAIKEVAYRHDYEDL